MYLEDKRSVYEINVFVVFWGVFFRVNRSYTLKKVLSPFTLLRNVSVIAIHKYRKPADWVVIPKNTTKGQYL